MLSAPLWGPVLAAIAFVVWRKMGAPVFFRQRRIGRDDRPFTILKFRTMSDARDAAGALLPDSVRLGSFGRWLRASSLDELPELINVLRGEMSLVGPRPLLPQYLPLYSREHRLRHRVPPGLTGLAQVSGRNALTWPAKFDLDVEYARSNSLLMDLKILAATIRSVFARHGISAPGEATAPFFTGYSDTPEAADATPPAPPPVPPR